VIGVRCDERERDVVREFFELFKSHGPSTSPAGHTETLTFTLSTTSP
jgi:hypothetical protein